MRSGSSSGDHAGLLARLYRVSARSPRPELSLRAVLAALSSARPGSRVELLVRDATRTWQTRLLTAPPGEEPTAPWPPPPPPEEGRPAPRTWQRPLPPREPSLQRLSPDQGDHPADLELARAGWGCRILTPLRWPGLRAALSWCDREPDSLGAAELELAIEAARIAGPPLLAEARGRRFDRKLERASRHAERARFVGRLTTGLNRSLAVPDVFRSATERLHRLVPFDLAWLSLLPAEGRDLVVYRLDADDEFRQLGTQEVSVAGSLLERLRGKRELTGRVSLDSVEAPTPVERALLEANCREYVLLPLIARRRVVGTLGLATRAREVLDGETLSLLRHVAGPLAVAVENARLFHEAHERSRVMTALNEVGRALDSAADRKDVTEAVLSVLHDTFAFGHSAVLTVETREDGEKELVMQASRGYSEASGKALRRRLDESGITTEAARTGCLVHVPDVRDDPRYVQGVAQGRSEVAVPLVAGGQVVGVLDIESTTVNAFSNEDLKTLELFSKQVALALQRALVFEEVRLQAMTDGLTGLLNQRYFNEKVARELQRSRRTKRPFTLILFDLDDLKVVNDRLGHVTGNRAIVEVGRELQKHVRSIDAAARFGGDEFALVLSETDGPSALIVVQRVQEALRRVDLGKGLRVTLSVGLATWRSGLEEVRDIVHEADQALYRAKSRGKDCASVSEGEPAP
jgi:diguanylate cyclase (GGDEF)-like protein